MRVSYNKLWKMLIDKNMKKMDLLEAIEMSPNTLAKLGRNEDVSMDVLKRICAYLDRKSTRLNSSHNNQPRMPSSA